MMLLGLSLLHVLCGGLLMPFSVSGLICLKTIVLLLLMSCQAIVQICIYCVNFDGHLIGIKGITRNDVFMIG